MEPSRRSRVRLKIVALLAALTALWAFAAVMTVGDGVAVWAARTVDEQINGPTSRLIEALQQERRLSATLLGGDTGVRVALWGSRAATDQALTDWRERQTGTGAELAAGDALADRLAAAAAALAGLDQLRADVDDQRLDRVAAQARYTAMIEAGLAAYGAVSAAADPELARQAGALVTLARGREAFARQDALLSGALAAGEFNVGERESFTQWVGVRRSQYAQAAAGLPAPDQAVLAETLAQPAVAELRRMEDRIVAQSGGGGAPPVTAAAWRDTADLAAAALADLERAATGAVRARSADAELWAVVRLALAGGLGLVAVLVAVVVTVSTSRALVRQVQRLRDAAHEVARERLPRVVTRLSAGEQVDVATEAPPLQFGDDQLGQVGQAFNLVQQTAVQAAVSQAELRRGVRDVFLSLARRTQNLVHRQLTALDGMERRETDPDKVAELYRIDHLATRMRRNAENLIVLSGARPGRTWRRPVSIIDVIRGAIAEVEHYTRVVLLPVDPAALDGRAVGDLIHLLAELIENAAAFSPPYARVSVGGERVAHGYAVAIEDRGLGMSEAELAAANQRLTDPGDFDLADASHLGHYVVAKLAQRHGIRVHLRGSPYGGIVAIVLVPSALLADTPDDDRAVASASTGQDPQAAEPASGPATTDSGDAAGERSGEDVAGAVADRGGPGRGAGARGAGGGVAGAAPVPPRGDASGSPAPAGGAGPAAPPLAATTADHREAGVGGLTPAGLPWRVRQASLPAPAAEQSPIAEPTARDPEQARLMMQAYQRGTRRGRASTAEAGGGPIPDPRPARKDER